MDFKVSLLFFCSKENPIMISSRYVLMDIQILILFFVVEFYRLLLMFKIIIISLFNDDSPFQEWCTTRDESGDHGQAFVSKYSQSYFHSNCREQMYME